VSKSLQEALREAEGRYCRRLLRKTRGCVARAASIARVNRTHFYRVLRRNGLFHRRADRYGNSFWRSLADSK
jgi:DNA-binding NtrC family response regulator